MVAKDSLELFPCLHQPLCSKTKLTAQVKTVKMCTVLRSPPNTVAIYIINFNLISTRNITFSLLQIRKQSLGKISCLRFYNY